ncbi:MAG: hypothetical protein U1A78_41655 [Polyangia bacterium]
MPKPPVHPLTNQPHVVPGHAAEFPVVAFAPASADAPPAEDANKPPAPRPPRARRTK